MGDSGAGLPLPQLECSEPLACVPTAVLSGAARPLSECRSLAGAEGRCLPACLLGDQAEGLPRGECDAAHLCVPCFDPLSGDDSGLCRLGDDVPEQPAFVFERCCEDQGRCVPEAMVPEAQLEALGRSGCAEGMLCAPEVYLLDPGHVAQSCHSLLGAEGRCLLTCPDSPLAADAARLPRAECAALHRCVPCVDPLSAESTGACEVGGDSGPSGEPALADSCCEGIGLCIPATVLEPESRESLQGADCQDPELLCAPRVLLADPYYVPESCSSLLGAEGRCLPSCLKLGAIGEALPSEGCASHHSCVPCFEPLDGEPTGVCDFAFDPGPQGGPVTFGRCCHELGRCVPETLVPEAERGGLGQDSCGAQELCSPEPFLRDRPFIIQSCSSSFGAEGRCIPDCLPDVADIAELLPTEGCAAGTVCAPCFDPVSGAATGLCELSADPGPTEPPFVLERCCGEGDQARGRCLPLSEVPQSGAALPQESCASADSACVPTVLLDASGPGLKSCSPGTGQGGRCLPDCVIPQLQRLFTSQADCPDGDLCAPCQDLFGQATGLCEMP